MLYPTSDEEGIRLIRSGGPVHKKSENWKESSTGGVCVCVYMYVYVCVHVCVCVCHGITMGGHRYTGTNVRVTGQ